MKHIVMIKIRNVPYRNSTGIIGVITQTLSLMTTRVVYSYYTLKFNACFYFVNFPLKLPRHFRRIRGIIIWHKLHVLTVKSRSLIAWDASRHVLFRNGSVRITGFVSYFVYKGTTKWYFEKLQKFNEFSKLSTKSCLSRTMNNLKESFTTMKARTTRTTILKITLYVCTVCCLKKPYILNLLLTSTAWSLPENIRPRSLCTDLAFRLGRYRQDLGLIFSRSDRTLG